MKTIIIFIRSPCKHSNQGLQPLTVNHFQDYYFNCKPKSGLSIFAVNLYQDETFHRSIQMCGKCMALALQIFLQKACMIKKHLYLSLLTIKIKHYRIHYKLINIRHYLILGAENR
jgi:hypothetical protein